jgi:diguanylate cyclase (GGDEF)-like protein/hemerythrin-like metal-binding protein/PAS domain S-box-containing protein
VEILVKQKKFVTILLYSLMLALIYPVNVKATETTINIAILAFRPAVEVQSRWQPLIKYLDNEIPGYKFNFQALGYTDLENAIAQRTIDFVMTNPAHYMLMTYRNGLSSPLATLIPEAKGNSLPRFGGVIIARADNHKINMLDNLRNRNIAIVTKGSLGGYQTQAIELHKAGLVMSEDVNLIETGMPHDRVVKAVINGKAEAGFIRTGVLEEMQREGKQDTSQLKIIAPKYVPGFPLLLSTQLYPEWPFAAMPGVDENLARKVAAVLLSLPHNEALAKELNIKGFTIPTDYEIVRQTLEILRLPPFDEVPEFTLKDIWHKYYWQVISGLALISIIAILLGWLLFLNKRLKEGRQRLQKSAQKWQGLLTALGEGVYGVNKHGKCTFINPAALAMLGFSEAEVLGQEQHSLFHHHRENGNHYPSVECPIFMTLNDDLARNWKDWFWRKDGTGFPVMLTTAPTGSHNGDTSAVVVFRDISEQSKLENQLRKEATTDPLTGISNRRSFLNQFHKELERFKRYHEPASMLLADIDHFKKINDTYGHAAGDQVLRLFTKLTRQCLRSTDIFGRLGGEEFGIILASTEVDEAILFAERLRQTISETSVNTEQGDISFTISIGVADFGYLDEMPEDITERADECLYQAKNKGRNKVEHCQTVKNKVKDAITDEPFIQLKWKDRYASGNLEIDHEHQELFRLSNALLDQLTQMQLPPEQFQQAFETLLDYVIKHCEHEEQILRANGSLKVEDHVAHHRELIQHATELGQQIGKAGINKSEVVNFLITDVVLGHMLYEDSQAFNESEK